ncbi:hypothetical protein KCP74_20835 [Salmonella enterica subsp. enterica]|nr:hypothetical protein KCP74_20835 [Salmonella enterica subsp. enterica]
MWRLNQIYYAGSAEGARLPCLSPANIRVKEGEEATRSLNAFMQARPVDAGTAAVISVCWPPCG